MPNWIQWLFVAFALFLTIRYGIEGNVWAAAWNSFLCGGLTMGAALQVRGRLRETSTDREG